MLHAILHRKLGLLTPEPQRLEDAVTSTTFGTLALVERWDIVLEWLSGSSTALLGDVRGTNWFWPTLRTAERVSIPDVCVRIGDRLFVVEAKYGSGRHDRTDVEQPEEVLDQLVCQHSCITAGPDNRIGYAEGLRRALDQCAVEQIYLVDARRIRRASMELAQSRMREPRMDITLATWQRLDRLLYERGGGARWATDLRQFLDMQGLGAFIGFGGMAPAHVAPLSRWRFEPSGSSAGLRAVLRHAIVDSAVRIGSWRGRFSSGPLSSGLSFREISRGHYRAVLGWRSRPPNKRSSRATNDPDRVR
jgi:hypothetical protein